MKVILFRSTKEDYILDEIIKNISKVLMELQIEVKPVSLKELPYYNGSNIANINAIASEIEASIGVIMASTVELLSVSGSLVSLFEYLANYPDKNIFNKPLFSVTTSSKRGEREAAEYMLHSWGILGGSEFGKVGIYTPLYQESKQDILRDIEKMTESFYRMIRQERGVIRSSDSVIFKTDIKPSFEPVLKNEIDIQVNDNYEEIPAKSKQEQDIQEIASLFMKQLQEESANVVPEPKLKTTNQMISSLPHYFQAQYAVDFECIVQYNVSSNPTFSGYIRIENGECFFEEGIHSDADVELTATEEIFKEILTKKITSQKAFMLGQLKVRGNFMLLSKIDQMFKSM